MDILPSARKHGVADVDMVHAVENAIDVFDLDDEAVMIVGPARDASFLEVVIDHGRIFHAMPARAKFQR